MLERAREFLDVFKQEKVQAVKVKLSQENQQLQHIQTCDDEKEMKS
jgi:hypothetical protein